MSSRRHSGPFPYAVHLKEIVARSRGRARPRISVAAALVLVAGLAGVAFTTVLLLTNARRAHRDEIESLSAQTAALVGATLQQTGTIVAAGGMIADSTKGDPAAFRRALAGHLGVGFLSDIALLRLSGDRIEMLTTVGRPAPLLRAQLSSGYGGRLRSIALSGSLGLVRVADVPGYRVVGFAVPAGPGSRLLVYGEFAVPAALVHSAIPGPHGLQYAYYVGQPRPGNLLVSTANTLPFRHGTQVHRVTLGATTLTLVYGTDRPAPGFGDTVLPWLVLGLGVAAALALATFVELTRRRRDAALALADELRATEDEYRTFVEQLPLATYVDRVSAPCENLYSSPQIEQMFGYTTEEWAEDPSLFPRVLHPDDLRHWQEHSLDDIPAGGSYELEYRIISRDGAVVWVRDAGVVERDADGKPLFTRGFLLDITERKEAELALTASERRYRDLFESANDGIAIFDLEGRFTEVNQSLEDILGFARDQLLGRHFTEFLHGEFIERTRSNFDLKVAGSVERTRYEIDVRHQDGRTITIEISSSVKRDGDTPVGIQAIIRDVTERRVADSALRASEERYRSLFEDANDFITTADLDENLTDVNPAFERALGYTREELLGMNLRDVIAPDDLALIAEQTARKLSGEAETTTYELEFVAKNGSRVAVEISTRLILKDGEPIGTHAVGRDITERRRLERQLAHSQRLEAIGRLAGGIAHDFNNVLQAISGYSELLLTSLERGAAREDAAEIRRAADRATELTRQLLAFSRRQVLQPRVIALNDVVLDVRKMLERLLGEDVELDFRLSPALDPVMADPAQIEQVVVNLAVNARDAMPGGGTLTIETSTVELDGVAEPGDGLPPGRYAALRISDTGEGMDELTRARVFEPFFTTKRPGKGTGLGLATVYGVVKQSGGTIEVESSPGTGTSFSIYLPCTDAPEPDALVPQSGDAARAGSETVLLVEDETAVRDLVRTVLERNGYTVLTAADGEAALELCELHGDAIDLLLSDIVMPRLNGIELGVRVATRFPWIRTLFMSGYSEAVMAGKGFEAGGITYIQKPFTVDDLARRVRAALDEQI